MRTVLIFVFAVLCCAGLTITVAAQSITSTSPQLLKMPRFTKPKAARGLTGTLRVNVAVDSRGKVISVLDVVGPGDVCRGVTRPDVVAARTAARNAAMKATFAPATSGDSARSSQAWIEFELAQRQEGKKPRTPGEKDKITATGDINYSASNNPGGEPGSGKELAGGVLSGQAVNLPKPPYPAAARAVRASGAVRVQVLIEFDGSVFTARAVAGHPLLRANSVIAACEAKFTPTTLSGQPVKVSGIITYNYVP